MRGVHRFGGLISSEAGDEEGWQEISPPHELVWLFDDPFQREMCAH